MIRLLPLLLFSLPAFAQAPLLLYNYQHCEGEDCTIYSILVQRDGAVQLHGDRGQVRKGRFEASLPMDSIQAWDQLLDQAGLFDKESNYAHIERMTRASYLEYFTEQGHSIRHRIINVESPEIDALEPRLQALVEQLDWKPKVKSEDETPYKD